MILSALLVGIPVAQGPKEVEELARAFVRARSGSEEREMAQLVQGSPDVNVWLAVRHLLRSSNEVEAAALAKQYAKHARETALPKLVASVAQEKPEQREHLLGFFRVHLPSEDPVPSGDLSAPNKHLPDVEQLEAFLAQEREAGFLPLASMASISLGIWRSMAGKLDEELEGYQRSLELAEECGSEFLASYAAFFVCLALSRQGRQAEVLELSENYHDLYLRYPRIDAVEALRKSAGAFWMLGHSERAIELLEDAKAKVPEDCDVRAFLLGDLGMIFGNRGERTRAELAFREAIRILEEQRPPPGDYRCEHLALFYMGLADIVRSRGDDLAVKEYEEKARVYDSSRNDPQSRAFLLLAEDRFDEALALAREHRLERVELQVLFFRGRRHAAMSDHRTARSDLEAARALAIELHDPNWQGLAELELGILALRGRDLETASGCFGTCASLAEQAGDLPARAVAASWSSSVALERGEDLEALAHLELARRIALRYGSVLRLDEDLIGWNELGRDIYEDGLSTCFTLREAYPGEGFGELALRLAEDARARALRESILKERSGGVRGPDREFQQRRSTLLAKINRLGAERRATASGSDRARALELEISGAMDDYDRLVIDLEGALLPASSRETDAAWTAAETPADWIRSRAREAQDWVSAFRSSSISPDQAVLLYALGEEKSRLFVLTSGLFEVYEIPGRDAVEARVDGLLDAVRRDLFDEVCRRAAELDDMLLGPAEAVLERIQRVTVVPDDSLALLPFEILATARPSSAQSWSVVPFRVRTHSFHYVPSLSVLELLHKRSAGSGARTFSRDLLVVADTSSGSTLAPNRELDLERILNLPALEYAAREAELLANVFPESDQLIGERATEANLSASISNHSYRYVHFATHGFLDPDSPPSSGILLRPDAEPPTDGFLWMLEVAAMPFTAELVSLAACNSGSGKLAGAEGLIALPHAFLSAGTDAVLVSMWEAADSSTPDMMQSFYRALAAGESKDVALRHAKLGLLDSGGAFSAPRFWAPFLLIGTD